MHSMADKANKKQITPNKFNLPSIVAIENIFLEASNKVLSF